MSEARAPAPDVARTIEVVGTAFVESLQARGRSRSHVETVESHLRVHLVPCFGARPIDRISAEEVTRLLARLHRAGRRPKTVRNIFSTRVGGAPFQRRADWLNAAAPPRIDPRLWSRAASSA